MKLRYRFIAGALGAVVLPPALLISSVAVTKLLAALGAEPPYEGLLDRAMTAVSAVLVGPAIHLYDALGRMGVGSGTIFDCSGQNPLSAMLLVLAYWMLLGLVVGFAASYLVPRVLSAIRSRHAACPAFPVGQGGAQGPPSERQAPPRNRA